MSFDVVSEIINNYIAAFYPTSMRWLECNGFWNVKHCRCLDEVELNVATEIFGCITNEDKNHTVNFVFNNLLENDLYFVRFYSENCKLTSYSKCKKCDEMFFLNSQQYKEQLKKVSIEEIYSNYNSQITIIIVLALILLNRDCQWKRSDIFKYMLARKPCLFLKYLMLLTDFIENTVDLSEQFIQFHLDVIEFVLGCNAGEVRISIIDDILNVLNEGRLKDNFDNAIQIIPMRNFLKKNYSSVFESFPTMSLTYFQGDVSIISKIISIANVIKKDYGKHVHRLTRIYELLEKILKNQKRSNEDMLKNDMDQLKEILY